jgi:hypothetical protein
MKRKIVFVSVLVAFAVAVYTLLRKVEIRMFKLDDEDHEDEDAVEPGPERDPAGSPDHRSGV